MQFLTQDAFLSECYLKESQRHHSNCGSTFRNWFVSVPTRQVSLGHLFVLCLSPCFLTLETERIILTVTLKCQQ